MPTISDLASDCVKPPATAGGSDLRPRRPTLRLFARPSCPVMLQDTRNLTRLPPKSKKGPKIISSPSKGVSVAHTVSKGVVVKKALTYLWATDLIYAENDVPQPQPPVAFGFSNVKPDPIMFDV